MSQVKTRSRLKWPQVMTVMSLDNVAHFNMSHYYP